MNFIQLHERLRLEVLRRIQRGTLTVSLLARQTGLGQPHLSNFLRNHRRLSLEALDRVLAALRLAASDLFPARPPASEPAFDGENAAVPVVSHAAALFEPFIRSAAVQSALFVPAATLQAIRSRVSTPRRSWQRFVAVRIAAADAAPMEPLLLADSIAVLDRHYNSLQPYRPSRPNLYAIRRGAHLTLRYADLAANRLVLRPHNLGFPVDLIELDSVESTADLIAGRVALIVSET